MMLLLVPAFARAQAGADSLLLVWTAPGDDDMHGTAAGYELRRSNAPITADNFAAATLVAATPAPQRAGTIQSTMVRGLRHGVPTWFALRTRDAAGNVSDLSNVFLWNPVFDTSPPAAPAGLDGSWSSLSAAVQLSWAPNTESDLQGYRLYRAPLATGPWACIDSLPAGQESVQEIPPTGPVRWCYAVTAVDRSGNESPRSTPVAVVVPGVDAVFALGPAVPNPSRASASIRFALQWVSTMRSGRLEILGADGRLVRRIEVPPGLEVLWDGRDGSGARCAPGLYFARLVVEGRARTERVVRIP